MAKKKPEAAPAPAETQAQAPAAEPKQKQVYINHIPDAMIHYRHSEKTGKDYASVGVNMMRDGERIVGNVLVPKGFVVDSTRFQGNQKVPNPGFKDVRLGSPDYEMNVTIGPKQADGTYPQVKMTAAEIQEARAEADKAYKAEKAAKAKESDGRGVPETPAAENEGPAAENDGLGA